jgi:hypothetical protein
MGADCQSIDIIRGEKGAGKSAIYSLLMTRVGDFFDRGILLIAAENPRGATVFKDLVADPPTTENEFIALWKLYAMTIIAQQLSLALANFEQAHGLRGTRNIGSFSTIS